MIRQPMPPRRELPPEVRDRLRRRLWSELDRPREARRVPVRVPVAAIACAATVVVAGSVVFAQNVPQAPDQMRASMGLDPVSADASGQLDRCYTAVSAVREVPDRAQWRVVRSSVVAGVAVTAARVAGKPVFCETAGTAVTVSDPDAAPAPAGPSSTGALFATSNGTIAGVADPGWQRFELRVTVAPDRVVSAEAELSDGLFVARLGVDVETGAKVEAVRGSAYTFGPIPPVIR
ncbi:hypothetical protein ALI144C_39610 [Actinosynnema sp. ALI-1.44]|uniref:hypothetical protein n=1 Tax=Actinosynnema sp. ALI-1.44 TaxID=1933779 RepID=UPI00097BC348|nr:hypothetical protein [Actinosynnema sp. ALI-1.44]ONI74894.1 hypothetical protein ALI144C_39610 [Actinosynnema sp. ALI-1.44]